MTRAEERALEKYPSTEKEWKSEFGTFHFDDTNVEHREGFIIGYEQAEKDMKERFIQFVHRHYPINYTSWIQDFQKAMEDEK